MGGAPPGAHDQLVRRARGAARDELRHTALCLERVTHLAGIEYGMELPPPPPPRAPGAAPFVRLALEAYEEGCLGKGTAAAIARRAGGATNGVIAEEEGAYAELSWDVLAWCRARGGAAVTAAVEAAITTTEALGFRAPTADAEALRRGERLDAEELGTSAGTRSDSASSSMVSSGKRCGES